MLSNTLGKCSVIFFKRSRMFSNVPDCFQRFQNLLDRCGMLSNTAECSRICVEMCRERNFHSLFFSSSSGKNGKLLLNGSKTHRTCFCNYKNWILTSLDIVWALEQMGLCTRGRRRCRTAVRMASARAMFGPANNCWAAVTRDANGPIPCLFSSICSRCSADTSSP